MLKETTTDDRLTQLRELRSILAERIDQGCGARDLASLARQYRETLREIEDAEREFPDDEISRIIAEM